MRSSVGTKSLVSIRRPVAVDPAAALVALEDPGEDQVQERAAPRSRRPRPRPARSPARRAAATARSRSVGAPPRARRRGPARRPTPRRCGRPASRRRRSRSTISSISPSGRVGRGEEAVEHGRLAVDPREQEAAARRAGQRASRRRPRQTRRRCTRRSHFRLLRVLCAPASAVTGFPAAIAPCMNSG